MNYALAFLIVLFGLVVPCKSYSMDALEQAYKEQLEGINRDIAHTFSLIHQNRADSQELEEITNKMEKDGAVGQNYLDALQLKKESGLALINNLEKYAAHDSKRRELKVKILEKYGRLPKWWAEPKK